MSTGISKVSAKHASVDDRHRNDTASQPLWTKFVIAGLGGATGWYVFFYDISVLHA